MQNLSVPHSFFAWLASLTCTVLLKLSRAAFAPPDRMIACREDVSLGGRICSRGVAWGDEGTAGGGGWAADAEQREEEWGQMRCLQELGCL